ncbi:restriction endonuclease subunit S [Enorma massiliensis]|uniref:restriction endonuclease subunit S n=1 Tax=Enorma massiliensis TaxID=1472761 RepID=UPI00320AC48E
MGERVPLNSLCSKGKSTLRQKDLNTEGLYPVYGASGIIGYMDTYQNEHEYIAVVKDGAGVGRATICSGKSSVLGTMQALLPNEGVECGYLLHLVRALNLGSGFSGSTIPHIYFKDYGKRLVPSFSLKGQKDISARFDKIESQINLGNRILERCGQLVKSQFVEMFGKDRYPILTIGDVSSGIRYGTSKKASEDGRYIYLRMNNLTDDGRLDLSDIKRIDLTESELEKCVVEKGDLLFNRTNSREKVGKTAVFDLDEPMVIAGYIIRVRLQPEVDSIYLSTFMNLAKTKALLQAIAKGAVHQANINARQLAAIEFPLPPLPLQQQFASFVAEVDKSRFVARKSAEHIMNMQALDIRPNARLQ